jgi:predicted regulator of Ras-like GTPase activity (Roadblock/LC7/MglB family)
MIEKEIEDIGNVAGIVIVAVLDNRRDALATAGKPEDVTKDKILAQTSIIHSASRRGGKKLNKGTADEIDVIWEWGISILKTLNENYTPYVMTAKDGNIAWIRNAMKATAREIQKILGG